MEWISVEDRLPDGNESVLAIQKTGLKDKVVTIVARYIRKFEVESNDDYDDWSEYCEGKDEYFLPSGWYENQWNWGDYAAIGCNEKITHWMPLPQPPIGE